MTKKSTIYFHSPCFDGIVSAVLAWDFLEARQGWTAPTLHPVNYHLRERWLSSTLERPCAIVDFLYHHQAEFWADHHLTTFLDEDARMDFGRRKSQTLIYDQEAQSCAGLLWRHLEEAFDHRNDRYSEIVKWADKIDSARYESVSEAIFSSTPALRINVGMALGDSDQYCKGLVRVLRDNTLDQAAKLPEVKSRYERVQVLIEAGLNRLKKAARLEHGEIVVFDVDSKGVIISRYSPYYFFPNARYSAGIVRWEGGAKITVMRNPWREFESVFLGRICEKFGGGGHQRVGSVSLRGEEASQASVLLNHILLEIRREEKEIKQLRQA